MLGRCARPDAGRHRPEGNGGNRAIGRYTPRGENYTYNLWDEPEETIKAVLDHDFGLMARAGVTANRSFTIIPPKWVTYIYETYGRFPAYFGPYRNTLAHQAHHLDLEFYDEFYNPGAYTETQAQHMSRWH